MDGFCQANSLRRGRPLDSVSFQPIEKLKNFSQTSAKAVSYARVCCRFGVARRQLALNDTLHEL